MFTHPISKKCWHPSHFKTINRNELIGTFKIGNNNENDQQKTQSPIFFREYKTEFFWRKYICYGF